MKRLRSRLGPPVARALATFGYRLTGLETSVSQSAHRALALAYLRLAHELEPDLVESEARIDLLLALIGTSIPEGVAICVDLARTRGVAGDVCEFGVAQGATSALIAHELLEREARLHLYDSFEGLPAPTEEDRLKDDIFGLGSMAAYEGTMANPESLVRERLARVRFPRERTVVHRGFVSEASLRRRGGPERVSFAYVDFDFYEPIRLALEFLDERTDPGACVIVDDYDFFSTGARQAVDEFAAARAGEWSMEVAHPDTGHFARLRRG